MFAAVAWVVGMFAAVAWVVDILAAVSDYLGLQSMVDTDTLKVA